MAVRIEAGFSNDDVNGLDFDIEAWDMGGASRVDTDTVSINYTGDDFGWSHSGFDDYLGGTRYQSLAAYLLTQVALVNSGFSCTFNTTALRYEFSSNLYTHCKIIPNNQATKDLLGFSAAVGPSLGTCQGDTLPQYIYESQNMVTALSEDYEPEDLSYVHVTEGGGVYTTTSLGVPVHHDFTLRMEPKAGVYTFAASGAWCLQDHFEYVRGSIPFLVSHATGDAVHFLRGDEAYFEASRTHPEHDSYFDVPFRTYVSRS